MCGDAEQNGGGPADCGSVSGRGVLVSAVQLYLQPGVEDEESVGVGYHQPVAVRGPVDELCCHLDGVHPVQQVQDGAGTVGWERLLRNHQQLLWSYDDGSVGAQEKVHSKDNYFSFIYESIRFGKKLISVSAWELRQK